MSNWVCGYRNENGEYPCDERIPLLGDYCLEHMEEVLCERGRENRQLKSTLLDMADVLEFVAKYATNTGDRCASSLSLEKHSALIESLRLSQNTDK